MVIQVLEIPLFVLALLLVLISKSILADFSVSSTRVSYNDPWLDLPYHYTVNNTANKFTILGCDAYGYFSGNRLDRNYPAGCNAMCYVRDDLLEGSCTGLGCCQASIPRDVSSVQLELLSYDNYTYVSDLSNCSHAFVVEESAFTYHPENLTNMKNVRKLPMIVDWAVGNETCEQAVMNETPYACKSQKSLCYNPGNGSGYRCQCEPGYQGNPYLLNVRRALRYDGPEEEINLANFFLNVLREDPLFHVVAENIVSEENREQITEVAMLAKTCLSMKGEDRPSMKDVARVLDGLRQQTVQESASVSAEGLSGITLDISSYSSMDGEYDVANMSGDILEVPKK